MHDQDIDDISDDDDPINDDDDVLQLESVPTPANAKAKNPPEKKINFDTKPHHMAVLETDEYV